MTWSLLIKNGTVVDGSGAPGASADVALEGDRIAAIGLIPYRTRIDSSLAWFSVQA